VKTVAIIGTVGLPANYGGFETLAENLVDRLGDSFSLHVYCSKYNYPKYQRAKKFNGAALHYLPFKANGAQSILYDAISIIHALTYADTLVILGVPGCIVLPFIKVFFKKKIILNVDGIEWKRQKWGWFAKRFLLLSEKVGVRFADKIIADNEGIKEYLLSNYGKQSDLIAYGGDSIPLSGIEIQQPASAKYSFIDRAFDLSICRIEPENNIELILNAYRNVNNIELVIVGNWNYSAYGRRLKSLFSNHDTIHLIDPIYDKPTLRLLRFKSRTYVHGHSAGGTNPSLVEAMSCGCAIIAFHVTYNRHTTKELAWYFSDENSLQTIILEKTATEIEYLSATMKKIADESYTWDIICEKYRWII
jgi:glycosyltransferase involved in cell wall biosynthesis